MRDWHVGVRLSGSLLTGSTAFNMLLRLLVENIIYLPSKNVFSRVLSITVNKIVCDDVRGCERKFHWLLAISFIFTYNQTPRGLNRFPRIRKIEQVYQCCIALVFHCFQEKRNIFYESIEETHFSN